MPVAFATCEWIFKAGRNKGERCYRGVAKYGRIHCSIHHPLILAGAQNLRVKHYNEIQDAPLPRPKPKGEIFGDGNNKIIPFGNVDKDEWQESWYPGRSLINFPHSYRACICGRVSTGKGTVVKNIICRADPPFERVIVWHVSPENTHEWDDTTDEVYDALPEMSELNSGKKTLLVIDDVDCFSLDKVTKSRLDRLFGFGSSHCNLSIAILNQDLFRIPPSVRKNCNVVILWRIPDSDSVNCIARRLGLDAVSFRQKFKLLKDHHDSLCFDMSGGPEIRKNIFEVISAESVE